MTVIFVHIPKCGGSSVRNVFNCEYGADNIYDPFEQPNFSNAPVGEFDKYSCLFGHKEYGVHEKLKSTFQYVTVLRDPVKRLFSNWWYIRTHRTHRDFDKAQAASSAHEFYAAGGEPWGADGAIRMLAGVDPREAKAGQKASEAYLKQAQAHLQHFTAIGILEQFEETLIHFKYVLKWKSIPFCPQKINAGIQKPTMSKREAELLTPYAANDRRLYAMMRTQFSRHMHLSPLLVEEAKKLAILNKLGQLSWKHLTGTMRGCYDLTLWARQAILSYKEVYGLAAWNDVSPKIALREIVSYVNGHLAVGQRISI